MTGAVRPLVDQVKRSDKKFARNGFLLVVGGRLMQPGQRENRSRCKWVSVREWTESSVGHSDPARNADMQKGPEAQERTGE